MPSGPPRTGSPSAARSSTSSAATRSSASGGLEQRDRQVEEGQQLGLVGASLRTHHPPRTPPRATSAMPMSAASSTAVVGPHRAVEVLVELRLRQPPDDLEVHSAMIGRRLLAAAAAVALIVVLGRGQSTPRDRARRERGNRRGGRRTPSMRSIVSRPSWRRRWTRRAPVRRRSLRAKRIRRPRLIAAADGLVAAAPSATELRERGRGARARSSRPATRGRTTSPGARCRGSWSRSRRSSPARPKPARRFAEIRRGAESVSGSVIDALDAAAAGRLDEADEHLAASLAAVDAVRELEEERAGPVGVDRHGRCDDPRRAGARGRRSDRRSRSGLTPPGPTSTRRRNARRRRIARCASVSARPEARSRPWRSSAWPRSTSALRELETAVRAEADG